MRILKPRITKTEKTPRRQPEEAAFSDVCESDMPRTWLDVDDEFWEENQFSVL